MQGKVVVVTGATSGIGESAALQLADLGATVVPVGRDAKRLERVGAELRKRGSEAEPLQADFASQDEVRHLAGLYLRKTKIRHVNHVRMAQATRGARFAFEALDKLVVAHELRRDEF